MTKRAKCPKCKRDTWSEKWESCSSCHSQTDNPALDAADKAQARADAAGDKRQSRSQQRRLSKQVGVGTPVEEDVEATDAMGRRAMDAMVKHFQPSAEEVEVKSWEDVPLQTSDWPAGKLSRDAMSREQDDGPVITVVTNQGKFDLVPPKPGATCPTCNRKVPKRRKADA